MLTILTGLVSSGVKALIPGLPPRLFYAVAILMSFSLVAGFFYMKGAAGKAEAVQREKYICEARIEKQKLKAERTMSSILEEINNREAEAKEPETKKEEDELCKRSKLCRKDK